MKVCIVYYSRFGNGKKCAEYVEETLKQNGHSVELFSVTGVRADSLPVADLFIFSSPTQIGNPPGKIRRFLRKLKLPLAAAKYALISTCADENNQVLPKLSEILDKKGLQKAAAGVKIKVLGLKGPLEENYTQKLDSFVQKLSEPAIS